MPMKMSKLKLPTADVSCTPPDSSIVNFNINNSQWNC
jgi:hypothetical protein